MSESIFIHQNEHKLKGFIKDILRSLFSSRVTTTLFTIYIPKDIIYRTRLLCEYISDELEEEFEIENFLMILYIDFIETSIKKYDIKDIYKKLKDTEYRDNSIIKLSNGTDTVYIDRNKDNVQSLKINIQNKSSTKGELILNEIYQVYGCKYTFPQLLECIWINFIESYKEGKTKATFGVILELIDKYF